MLLHLRIILQPGSMSIAAFKVVVQGKIGSESAVMIYTKVYSHRGTNPVIKLGNTLPYSVITEDYFFSANDIAIWSQPPSLHVTPAFNAVRIKVIQISRCWPRLNGVTVIPPKSSQRCLSVSDSVSTCRILLIMCCKQERIAYVFIQIIWQVNYRQIVHSACL